jgi:hypothetical protein
MENIQKPEGATSATRVPTDPDALLSRRQLAQAATAFGLPIAESTLATLATRGGGPPYSRYGSRVRYRWSDFRAWAEARLSAPACSTSEHRAKAAA